MNKIAIIAVIFLLGCSKKLVQQPMPETLLDPRDGQKYKTVVINGTKWMAENLNYKTGNSWCYNYDDSKCKQYGRLYDYETAMTACPSGWHLSTRQDWRNLEAAIGVDSADAKLRTKTGWNKRIENCGSYGCPELVPGTDDFGFSALPGGYRSLNGNFNNAGYYGYWWMAFKKNCNEIALQVIQHHKEKYADESHFGQGSGLSVRCIQDGSGSYAPEEEREIKWKERIEKLSEHFTDSRDSLVYRTVKIGDATWMAENLNYRPQTGKSWCYGNDAFGCKQGIRFYDWETALTVCPSGWHLPSRDEWDSLAHSVGGKKWFREDTTISWSAVSHKLKAEIGWDSRFPVDWTDEYGFSAMPNGYRKPDGDFYPIPVDGQGEWWTENETEEAGGCNAFTRAVRYYGNNMDEYKTNKNRGYPIRCIKDGSNGSNRNMNKKTPIEVCIAEMEKERKIKDKMLDSVIAKLKNDERSFEEFVLLGRMECYGNIVDLEASVNGMTELYFRMYASLYNGLSPFTRLFEESSIKKSVEEYFLLNKNSFRLNDRFDKKQSFYYKDLKLCDNLFDKNKDYKNRYLQFVSDKKNHSEWNEEIIKDYLEHYFMQHMIDK